MPFATHPRRIVVASLLLVCLCAGCRRMETPAVPRHAARTIEVKATDEFLELRLDGRMKDLVDTTTYASEARYVAVLDLPRRYHAAPGSVLIAGIGSGCLAQSYAANGWQVTVAEPDERMVAFARQRFRLPDSGIAVDSRDARTVLMEGTATYDLVLLDLVGMPKAPSALLTKEFFVLTAGRLTEKGMLGIAVESIGWKSEAVQLLNTTLTSVFPQVTVMPIAEPPDRFGSVILVASREIPEELQIDVERNTTFHPAWRYGTEYQKTHAWDNHFTLPPERLPLQTDADNRWEAVFADLDAAARKLPDDYLP